MAIQLKINAQTRTAAGRNAVKKIKQAGFVPAVIYGSKVAAQNLQLVERDVAKLLDQASSESVLVEVQIEDGANSQTRTALIQEVQHHPVKGTIQHVDLHAVAMDELLTAEVPIETVGDPIGVRTGGGVLEHNLRSLEIECLPGDLPTVITVDVSNLKIGESLHVRDIVLPKGVTVLDDADLIAVAVAEPTVAEVTAVPSEAPAAAAPAATAEKKPDEGAAS